MVSELVIKYIDPKTLKQNPYSRKLFPELKGESYTMLVEDIKKNGIRTPIEVTKEGLILCGHERHRVALEFALSKVPVEIYPSSNVDDQKIRVIKDNLARKAVDIKTKLLCYRELKTLYGLKEREIFKKYPRDKKGHIKKPMVARDSIGNKVMSNAEIAKEVGFDNTSYYRAEKILSSDLPDKIKDAAFNGVIGLRPVADLINQKTEIKKEIIPIVLKSLKDGKNESILKLIDEKKAEIEFDKKIKKDMSSSVNIDEWLSNYAKTLLKIDPKKFENKTNLKHITNLALLQKFLKTDKFPCKECGNTKIVRECGHDI